jgi:hypothetical protein
MAFVKGRSFMAKIKITTCCGCHIVRFDLEILFKDEYTALSSKIES